MMISPVSFLYPTFIYLWEHPDKYDPQRGKLKTWLSIVARTQAVNRCREISKRNTISLENTDFIDQLGVVDNILEAETRKSLIAAVNALGEPNREILIRRYFENYYTDIADRRNHADNYLVKCQELLATLDRDIVASEASPLAIDGLNPDVVFDKTAPLETQHWLTGLHEHTLDGYGIPVGSAEGESALVLSAYVPQHKGEVDGGAEVPLLYFFTYSVDDIQSPEDYAFIHGQIITFEQLEQYKVYEDDQYVCYEVTDLFYTNLRQHVESIISQRSDIYFDEQVWERVENIYTYYKDRDVLASRFYYNVPVE